MAKSHYIWTLLLVLVSGTSSAAEFELGVGKSEYLKRKNMCWYDERYQYEEQQPTTLSFVLTGRLSSSTDWRIGYMDLGKYRLNATGLCDDKNPNTRTSTCSFNSTGHVRGLYATLRPGIDVFGVRLFADVGIFVFQPDFRVKMPDHPEGFRDDGTRFGSQNVKVEHEAKWEVNQTFGFGISDKRHKLSFSMHYLYLDQKDRTDHYVPAYKDAYVASVNVRF